MEKQYLEVILNLMYIYGDLYSTGDFSVAKQIYDYLQQVSMEIFQKQQFYFFLKNNKFKNQILNLKKIKSYLAQVFGDVILHFYKFKNIQDKVYRSTQQDKQSLIKESKQDFLNNLLKNQEEEEQNKTNLDIMKIEQKIFMGKRIDQMSEQEFQKFCKLRYSNFLEFKEKNFEAEFNLSDFFQKVKLQQKEKLSYLINYIFCKIIEKIVVEIIKDRGNKILVPIETKISGSEVKEKGSRIIGRIIQNKNNYFNRMEKNLEKDAFSLFEKEFYQMNYHILFNIDNNKGQSTLIQKCWKKMLTYKHMWIQRVQAHNQLITAEKNHINFSHLKTQINNDNQYMEYLVNQLCKLNIDYISQSDSLFLSNLFKDYLINNKSYLDPPLQQYQFIIPQNSHKKVKLESIFDNSNKDHNNYNDKNKNRDSMFKFQ